jgi:oligosaccharide repeat unit polymerase
MIKSDFNKIDYINKINFFKFNRKIILLFKIWIGIYLINIIGSGGIPLYWVFIGDSRTYVDFGLPTLGGLANMLRAFITTSCYLIYAHSECNNAVKRKFLLIGLFLLFSAFGLETGRGNGVVLLLHPIGLHFLFNKISLKSLFRWIFIIAILLLGLSSIQVLRYGGNIEILEKYAENSGLSQFKGAALLLVPAITYIAVPIVNTDLNLINEPLLKFKPYYSLQGFIPTIIRDHIFEKQDYGELVNEANNVSSFYVPLLRDFGILGCVFIVFLIQLITYHFYIKARRGIPIYVLSWPPLFMSLILSFFSLFFTSLVVLLYPFLVSYALKGTLNKNPPHRSVIK